MKKVIISIVCVLSAIAAMVIGYNVNADEYSELIMNEIDVYGRMYAGEISEQEAENLVVILECNYYAAELDKEESLVTTSIDNNNIEETTTTTTEVIIEEKTSTEETTTTEIISTEIVEDNNTIVTTSIDNNNIEETTTTTTEITEATTVMTEKTTTTSNTIDNKASNATKNNIVEDSNDNTIDNNNIDNNNTIDNKTFDNNNIIENSNLDNSNTIDNKVSDSEDIDYQNIKNETIMNLINIWGDYYSNAITFEEAKSRELNILLTYYGLADNMPEITCSTFNN